MENGIRQLKVNNGYLKYRHCKIHAETRPTVSQKCSTFVLLWLRHTWTILIIFGRHVSGKVRAIKRWRWNILGREGAGSFLVCICRFSSRMPFCFRKCSFRLRNLRFGCERPFGFGNLQFYFRNVVKLWNFATWFHKMSSLSQKVFSISESGLHFEI